MGVSFDHKLSPHWGYGIDVEHRRSLAASPQEIFLFLLAGNLRFTENNSFTFGARFEPAAHGNLSTLRFFTDLNTKLPIGDGPFTFESRLRYQQDRPPGERGSLRRVSIRPQIGLTTKLKDGIALVTELEGRFRFDNRNEWSRFRYTAGLEFAVTDRLKMEVFYRFENRVNIAPARSTTILGLYANYVLPDSTSGG